MMEMQSYLEEAIKMARGAGDIALKYFRCGDLHSSTKQNAFDVVTAADKDSDEYIKAYIRSHFPDHGILSEESGDEHFENEWRWVVDPLDGTTNFNNGLPVFSVSIALEHKGEAVVGVVYAPYLKELFYAIKSGGAYLNGRPIHCSDKNNLETAVVATGMPYDRAINPDNNMKEIENVVCKVRGTRRFGSAAIDLCYIAAGFFDAYWELNLNRWDVAAGILIAKESGARIESIRNNRNYSILAAPTTLIDQMRSLLI